MARPSAVVTGASSGIGAVFARRLADRGHPVLLAAQRDRLQALTEEIRTAGGEARITVADLERPDVVARVAEKASSLPELGLLVNSAGFGISSPVTEIPRRSRSYCLGRRGSSTNSRRRASECSWCVPSQ